MKRRRLLFSFTAVLCLAAVVSSCRDEPGASEEFNENLGTSDRPLMPIPISGANASILNGRATAVPIRNFEELDGVQAQMAAKGEIAELLEGFRAAYTQSDYEALVPMLAERQREAARKTAEPARKLRVAIERVTAALGEMEVDQSVLAEITAEASSLSEFSVDVTDLTFDSETLAVAPLVGTELQVTFEKTDEGWLIALSEFDDPAATTEVFDAISEMLTAMADVLENPELSLEEKSLRDRKSCCIGRSYGGSGG